MGHSQPATCSRGTLRNLPSLPYACPIGKDPSIWFQRLERDAATAHAAECRAAVAVGMERPLYGGVRLSGAALSRLFHFEDEVIDLSYGRFESMRLHEADFFRANLRGASLARSDLRFAVLRDACLFDVDGTGASFRNADFRGARLAGMKFAQADLSFAEFDGVDFADADLSLARLDTSAWVRNANFVGAKVWEGTVTHAAFDSGRGVLTWFLLRVGDEVIIHYNGLRGKLSRWRHYSKQTILDWPSVRGTYPPNDPEVAWSQGPGAALAAAEALLLQR